TRQPRVVRDVPARGRSGAEPDRRPQGEDVEGCLRRDGVPRRGPPFRRPEDGRRGGSVRVQGHRGGHGRLGVPGAADEAADAARRRQGIVQGVTPAYPFTRPTALLSGAVSPGRAGLVANLGVSCTGLGRTPRGYL